MTPTEQPFEWTPSTEHVRMNIPAAYISPAEFDRWLADHDREVGAKAWAEGRAAAYDEFKRDPRGLWFTATNPYRENDDV